LKTTNPDISRVLWFCGFFARVSHDEMLVEDMLIKK